MVFLAALLFAFITWRRFHLGIFFLFLLLPTYLIRFTVGPIPTTFLEVMILIVILVWIFQISDFRFQNIKKIFQSFNLHPQSYLLVAGIALFLLGATINIFTGTDIRAALGEWKAFYVEPTILFFILISFFRTSKLYPIPYTLYPILISGLATSLLAIYQHYTGFMVPWKFWDNGGSFRVTGWYGFPNAIGLFLAPLVPLAIFLASHAWKEINKKNQNQKIQDTNKFQIQKLKIWNWSLFVSCFLFLVSSPLAILFAKSTGGLVGLAAGILFLLLMYKKTRWPVIIVGLVSLISLPTNNPIKQELLAQNRSGQIRVAIWKETANLLSDRPLTGAGLASYQERIKPYHRTVNGEGIEIFHHPHNIFLTMWVNTGILGLIGFLGILMWFYKTGLKDFRFQISDFRLRNAKNNNLQSPISNLQFFLLASMTTLLVTGLVDSPYIKNDLAIVFWVLIALTVLTRTDVRYSADDTNVWSGERQFA